MMPLSVAAACSSKLKVRQKRLRSASPQARLMREPKGAWMMSCMPPASSKKRSATTVFGGRQRTKRGDAGCDVGDCLLGAGFVESALGSRKSERVRSGRESRSRTRETSRDSSGERPGASPSQNGMEGGGAMGIFDAHAPGLDAADAPGVRAEQENIAGEALDREILVERADGLAFGFGDDGVVAFSGIAPPEVMAASRAPRRPRTRPLT